MRFKQYVKVQFYSGRRPSAIKLTEETMDTYRMSMEEFIQIHGEKSINDQSMTLEQKDVDGF